MLKRTALLIVLFSLFLFFFFNAVAQPIYKVQGKVVDVNTKEPLKNVSVIIKENKSGGVTNDSGYFSITLRIPKFTMQISIVGYANITKHVDLSSDDKPFIIELEKRASATLDEVIVNAARENSRVKTVEMNITKINPELIKRSPLILGEADIIKALTLQPGITTAGEGAGGFNVRGGNADQNLVLIDGAPLFNTSHLLGFFTSVSPDAIQDVTLYKGSMPAEYGGRLSSLLNMKMKSGGPGRIQYITGISPVSARFFVNGPAIKNKLTFIAGARVAYPDIVLNQLPDKFDASRAFFYDGIIKGEYTINANNKISLTAYRSYDKFKFDTATSYDWQSNLLSLNLLSSLNSKLSLKINGNYSKFISGINNLPENYKFRLVSFIEQKQAKAIFVYAMSENNNVEAGADFIVYNILPGDRNPSSGVSNVNPLKIQNEKGREMSAFVNDEINFTDKITLQLGLRYTSYDYLGPKNVYHYKQDLPLSKETITDTTKYSNNQSIQNYSGFEPRIALKLGITDNLTFKLNYNRGQQFLHLISNTTAISPVDFWKLSDNYIKGQTGDQYAAGVFSSFKNNQYELSVEAYYRTIKNTVDYKDGATLLLNPYIESALLNARGRGYGIEFSLSKNTGRLTGQFNYSYSKSEIQILNKFPGERVNEGGYYPSNSDRPHNIAVITKLKLGGGWSFNCNFVFSSGRPATYPDGNYVYNNNIVTNYSKRNKDRLPAYHRLDAGFSYVSRRYSEQKKYSIWNISFYNLYMHHNAYSVYFQRTPYSIYFFQGVPDVLLSYRLSVVGSIIPSVSWTYNF